MKNTIKALQLLHEAQNFQNLSSAHLDVAGINTDDQEVFEYHIKKMAAYRVLAEQILDEIDSMVGA